MRRGDRLEHVMSPLRHELRNTLSPITMVVDMLAMRGGEPEIDVLSRAVQVLALHVDDLASLTRESHAQLDVSSRSIELAGVVASTNQAIARHFAQTGTTLTTDVPAQLVVQADPTCLALALGSALRHCALRSRTVHLAASLERKTVTIRIANDRALPPEAALVFARQLVELQRGTFAVRDDLQLSLPVGSIR